MNLLKRKGKKILTKIRENIAKEPMRWWWR